jgi:small subunit ribosomal protein S18
MGEEGALRKRSRYLEGVSKINVNDPEFLRNFVTEHGKIVPSRLTGATAGQQRQIKKGVRRARNMGILP